MVGHATGANTNNTNWTNGANLLEMASWFGPVNMADGMISPKNNENVTLKITAM